MRELVTLAAVRPAEMDEVLRHEREAWLHEVDWDYSPTTALISRSIAARTFEGFALREGRRVVGYTYLLPDRERSLLGSVHVLPAAEADGAGAWLLDRALEHLVEEVGARRIESQFLYFGGEDLEPVFGSWGTTSWAREFMRAPLDLVRRRLGAAPPADLKPFRSADVKTGGELVFASFEGSPDAELSACYSSLEGAEAFVDGVLTRTGCGNFEPTASFLARIDGVPAGLVLASRISPRSAHIVQISVHPGAQARGLGLALLAASAEGLEHRGFRTLSLSVTVANTRAREWYRRLGLEPIKEFAARVRATGASR